MDITGLQSKSSDWVAGLLANVDDSAYDRATPCAEWNVKDLVNHLIGGGHFFNTVMSRAEMPDGDMPDFTAMGPADATYRSAIDAYLATLNGDGALEGNVTAPFGEMPAQAFAGIALIDTVAHGWDLATATGQDSTIPDDILAVLDPMARQALGGFPRSPQLFDVEKEVSDDASPTERFVAFLGRSA